MKYISLFAGIGGFDLALNRLGHECVYANEWDKYAAQIYDKNFGHQESGESLQGTERGSIQYRGDKSDTKVGRKFQQSKGIDTRDIRTVPTTDIPDHDLLVGGFPCQAFSIAGKRRGFDDTRGTLFFEIARILKDKQPKFFILENVKGLLSSRTTLTFDAILDTLSTEVTLNICTPVPTKEWEVTTDNLSVYHQKIGGTNGLQKNFISLLEKTLPTIKKLNYYPIEKMRQLGLNENEWVSSLQQLSSIDSLNTGDIPLLEKMVAINGDFVLLWKNKLEENSNQQKLSTISTETSLTIDLKTCISALQELNIILFITKQWKLSTNLWNKVKSNSRKESTFYVKTFNIIISQLTELGYDLQWQVLNSKNFGVPQNRERVFIVGHIRGQPRPEIFPITGSNEENNEQVHPTLDANYYKGYSHQRKLMQIQGGSQGYRVYDTDGVSSTLAGEAGGVGAKTGLYAIPTNTKLGYDLAEEKEDGIRLEHPNSKTARGRVIKGASQSLKTSAQVGVIDNMKIRRLTPTECERLQGFPDGFTEGVSDTQRYKTLGNAVTVNVVYEVARRL